MDEPTPDEARSALEAARKRAAARFTTAVSGGKPNAEQIDYVSIIAEEVVELAALIDLLVPEGHNKSLAFTALEDAHMRANRAIFQDAQ